MTDETCAHFWKIRSPNGKTSMGTCKLCGEKRKFMNSIEWTGWRQSIKNSSGRAISKQAVQSRRQDGRFS
jgi:hypothetical protein